MEHIVESHMMTIDYFIGGVTSVTFTTLFFIYTVAIIKIAWWISVGVALSMQPSLVTQGVAVNKLNWRNVALYKWWIAFGGSTVFVVLADGFSSWAYMHYIVPTMWQMPLLRAGLVWVWVILLILGLLQIAGILDLTHPWRTAKHRLERAKAGMSSVTWEEYYIRAHPGSIVSLLCSVLFIVRYSWRTSWPYVVWAIVWKGIAAFLGSWIVLPFIVDQYALSLMAAGYIGAQIYFHKSSGWMSKINNYAYMKWMEQYRKIAAIGVGVTLLLLISAFIEI